MQKYTNIKWFKKKLKTKNVPKIPNNQKTWAPDQYSLNKTPNVVEGEVRLDRTLVLVIC